MTISKRGRPNKEQSFLNAEIILNCAKFMMARDGKQPSIRALAKKLNVDPMAIYYYYKNKSTLIEAIAVSLISKIYQPTGKQDWKSELYKLAQSYLAILAKYPSLLETLLSMNCESPANIFYNRFQEILLSLQLSKEVEKDALDLLVDYIHGCAVAMNSNSDHPMTLEVDMMKGPFHLFCRGLEADIN